MGEATPFHGEAAPEPRRRPRRGGDGGAPTSVGDVLGGRVPPHDLDAEKSVLSALLLDPRVFHEIFEEVAPDDFYHPAHQLLLRAMLTIHDERRPVDLITLSEHLTTEGTLDAVGGPVGLAEIADFAATSANVLHHARIVRDKAVKRRLIQVASEIAETGYDEDGNADQLLDFAESRIFEVSKAQSRSSFASLHDEMPATFDYVEAIMNRGGDLTGLPTGFRDLDEITGGLQPGELIIIAARPSMGKTAFALNIARNAAVGHGKNAAVFSLEMTTRSLIVRLLSTEAQINFASLRKGFLPMSDYRKLQVAADRLSQTNIWIDDSGALDILEIKAKSRRLHAEHGLDLVIVDYLQLVSAAGRSNSRKDLEIAEISRGLKALSKELDLPVVALSQLNRGPEQRDPDKRRPMMGDLRESGAIEQDADVIAFIYRDIVYNKETADPRLAEIIIEKQRNGPTGTVKLDFEGQFARFANRAKDDGPSDLPPIPGGFSGPDGFTGPGDDAGFDGGGGSFGGGPGSPPPAGGDEPVF